MLHNLFLGKNPEKTKNS